MTPSCHVSGLDLLRFRDGEATPAQTAEFEKHVEGCENCRLRLADAWALSRMITARLVELEHEVPVGFASSVMARLPGSKPRRGWVERLQFLIPPRRELTFGLIGLAVAASLAIVFAPSLRSHDVHLEETTENEAEIHSLEVSSPDRSAIVFDSAEGNTIIWMVPSADEDGGRTGPSQP
jgi:anti-sigma factor RsiW